MLLPMTIVSIWNNYHQDVERFILSKVNDLYVTDDLTQETFIKAQVNLEQLKDERKLKSWLLTIARNTVNDYFRHNKNTVPLELEEKVIDDAIVSDEHRPEDCLPGLIKNLPKKYRYPLFLSDIKGQKQTDIAKELQLPLATVKSQIQRARKMVKQGYIDCCDYKMNEQGHLVGEAKDQEDCTMCS